MPSSSFYAALKEDGDLGDLVMRKKGAQKGIDSFLVVRKKEPLSCRRVFETLVKLSHTTGKNSSSEK